MKAAWYERQGAANEVLQVGDMETPLPGAGQVRIRIAASGINPGDVKKRQDAFGAGMPYPRIIPHSDGAGTIDSAGPVCRLRGSANGYGATERRPTVPTAQPPNTPSCPLGRSPRLRQAFLWKLAPSQA
jgi:NADPH2:quinone reductase